MFCSAKTFETVFLIFHFKDEHFSASLIKDYFSLQFFSPIILNHLSYSIILEHAYISTCNSPLTYQRSFHSIFFIAG